MLPTMSPQAFVDKWSRIQLKERSASQSHLNDICALVGHMTPTEADPKGEFFAFEPYTEKTSGSKGFVDARYKGHFIWEYKGLHADLDKAYDQLQLYRESSGNPPLLITSDMQRIIIHTNFTYTVKKVYEIDFDLLLEGDGLALLKRVFYEPQSFEPDQTQEQVTKATAATFVAVAETLQKWARVEGRVEDSEQLAHFIIRLLFSLFAEDMGLLPDNVFTKLVTYKDSDINHFTQGLRNLFMVMRDGGLFGIYRIPYFNGGLFDDDFVPELPGDIMHVLRNACIQDWSSVDPSIFGTLFERIIDESKRGQLGLHYTSKDDIMLVVEPVLMQPLRNKWLMVKQQARDYIREGQSMEAYALLSQFANQIADLRVLDPACGSGNFLYVALQQLLDLQKEVIAFSGRKGLPDIPLTVNPSQLYGIEINPYAHELAQSTVWIGYIQWRFENGFGEIVEPILRPLHNIERKDAILYYGNGGQPVEPDWPEADVIIGNPPFLGGGRRMREDLGDQYVDTLFALYKHRVPGAADLVCYWFEKARAMLEVGRVKRVGLLATQAIRGGANRHVLDRIKDTGDIFMAWSDREWTLDGAMVHVSIVGFDSGVESHKTLDGQIVDVINSDLTSTLDVSLAKQLTENEGICFRGITKSGSFELTDNQAQAMLREHNTNNVPNSDVIKPLINALDITTRPRSKWIIDFESMTLEEAKQYEKPFEHILQHVKPQRDIAKDSTLREKWWLHERSRPALRQAVLPLTRFIATPLTSKHRLYIWISHPVLSDQANYIFTRDDDYFFGVLHSSIHELWIRRKGTQLREAESGSRYSPTDTFEKFPFPWPPGQEPSEDENVHVAAIAGASRKLVALRQKWLHPEGVGITISQRQVNKRTLTNLYNKLEYYRENIKGKQRNPDQWRKDVDGIITLDEIEELDHIHNELDQAVLHACGWSHSLTDDQILDHLLALNLERAAV